MPPLESINLEIFSEAGFNQALGEGRFNYVAKNTDNDFDSIWWSETQRFEEAIIANLGPETVFVSDHVPAGKQFGIDVFGKAKPLEVFKFVLSYLNAKHPDASVVVGNLLQAPMPAARLVLGTELGGLDQDAAMWFVNRASVERIQFGNIKILQQNCTAVDIRGYFPWLDEKRHTTLKPVEFWSKIYSGHELNSMKDKNGRDDKSYRQGSKIGDSVFNCLINSDLSPDERYLSNSLPSQKIIKLECSRSVFTPELFQKVWKIIRDADKAWSVRFSIFEVLHAPNCYLGGIIQSHDGTLFLEST